MALATHAWTGDVSNLWADAGNWIGGSPAGGAQAVLVFPSASNLNNVNDLIGIKVAASDFFAGSYVVSGNPITLIQGPQSATRRHMDAASKTNILAVDLVRSATNSGITFDVAATSGLSVDGLINGGATATNVIMIGPGELALAGANTFSVGGEINEGVLSIRNATAPGTTGSDASNRTTINGSGLELQGILFETETLATGAAGGTLRNVAGNSRWAGEILRSVTDLNVQVEGSTSLSIDGRMSDNVASFIGGLVKTGPGTLALTTANTYRDVTPVNAGVLSINHPAALGTVDGRGHRPRCQLTKSSPCTRSTGSACSL